LLQLRRPRTLIRGRRFVWTGGWSFLSHRQDACASVLARTAVTGRRYRLTGHPLRCRDLDARASTARETGKSGCEETGCLRLWDDRGSGGPERRDFSR